MFNLLPSIGLPQSNTNLVSVLNCIKSVNDFYLWYKTLQVTGVVETNQWNLHHIQSKCYSPSQEINVCVSYLLPNFYYLFLLSNAAQLLYELFEVGTVWALRYKQYINNFSRDLLLASLQNLIDINLMLFIWYDCSSSLSYWNISGMDAVLLAPIEAASELVYGN